jgi:hypothetical protein
MDPYDYRYNIMPETELKCKQVLYRINELEYTMTRACISVGLNVNTFRRWVHKNKVKVRLQKKSANSRNFVPKGDFFK